MYLTIGRTLGVFPFKKNGEFSPALFGWYVVQLVVILRWSMVPRVASKVHDMMDSRIDEFTMWVAIVGTTMYFLPILIHPVMTIWRKDEFGTVSRHFFEKRYCQKSYYSSYIGFSLAVASLYVVVQFPIHVLKWFEGPSQAARSLQGLCLHYTYGLDFLVTMTHSELTHMISLELERAVDISHAEPIQGMTKGLELMGMSKTISRIYGPQLAVRLTQTLLSSLHFFYGVITGTSPHYDSTWLEKTGKALIPVIIIVEFLCFCGAAEGAYRNAKKLHAELFKIAQHSDELCVNAKLRLFVIADRTINFSVCGLFSIGFPLFTSMASTITTYLVILVQLHDSSTQAR